MANFRKISIAKINHCLQADASYLQVRIRGRERSEMKGAAPRVWGLEICPAQKMNDFRGIEKDRYHKFHALGMAPVRV